MAKNIFLLFSHQLGKKQLTQIEYDLKAENIIYLPEALQNEWSAIPSEPLSVVYFLTNIKSWISERGCEGDFVLIQGDFGATYHMVNWSFENGFVPIYASSNRIHEEFINEDGTVQIEKSFAHVQFRKYEK